MERRVAQDLLQLASELVTVFISRFFELGMSLKLKSQPYEGVRRLATIFPLTLSKQLNNRVGFTTTVTKREKKKNQIKVKVFSFNNQL